MAKAETSSAADQESASYPRQELPKMARIRQAFVSDHIQDIGAEIAARMQAAGLQNTLRKGHRVAITAGSRGMGGYLEVLRGVVAQVKACGADPFLIPAMGSHGGATAEGQVNFLRGLNVTEQSVGCPIRATMETVSLGQAENGAEAHYDQFAYEADATIVLGRCKTHPSLHEGNGSGVLKMTTIGLGKQMGAESAHHHGLKESVRDVPKVSLAKGNIVLGLNVIENAYRQPWQIDVVPPQAFWEADHRGLEAARPHVAQIPFHELDLLVIQYIGKNISGAGMDPNVTGHWRMEGHGEWLPHFTRIVVLDLTDETQGNALGIGQADFTTRQLVEKINYHDTYINMLTAAGKSGRLLEANVPITLDTAQKAIEAALRSASPDGAPRVCWIKSTAHLEEMWVSEALLPEVKQQPHLEVLADPAPWPFDHAGQLAWQ